MNLEAKKRRDRVIIWAIYIMYLPCFLAGLDNYNYIVNNSTSIDLLYRVVGARMMMDGKSPYRYQWKAGGEEAIRYYHPIPRYSQSINGVTVTPAVLWLHQPVANADFCQVSRMWFGVELALVFLSGLLLLIICQGWQQKLLALLTLTCFFVFGRNLYLHLHSAQLYLVYAFVFILLYFILSSGITHKYIIAGVLVAVAAWLKPFFVLLVVPFLFRRNRKLITGFAVMAVVLALHAILMGHTGYWIEYASAMKEYANDVFLRDHPDFLRIYPPPFTVSDCVYPLRQPERFPLTASGLAPVQYYLQRVGIEIKNTSVFFIAATLVAVGISALTRHIKDLPRLMTILFLVYLSAELLAPVPRPGYYLVQWMLPAVLVITNYRRNIAAAVLMVAGLFINNGLLPVIGVHSGSLGEGLMILALLLFILQRGRQDEASQAVAE
ncbi:MAG TPA: glycosyltransferase 87 family protein [Chitinophagaceae bacterium]